ncbi:MAG: hypothetical protein HRF43_06740 [Phycisphaerae bacterium]|jgi:hypothetical protein
MPFRLVSAGVLLACAAMVQADVTGIARIAQSTPVMTGASGSSVGVGARDVHWATEGPAPVYTSLLDRPVAVLSVDVGAAHVDPCESVTLPSSSLNDPCLALPYPTITSGLLSGLGAGLVVLQDEAISPETAHTPVPPGSGLVALSGLLTIGAWQVVRSARGLRFSALPDWYHSSVLLDDRAAPADLGSDSVHVPADFSAGGPVLVTLSIPARRPPSQEDGPPLRFAFIAPLSPRAPPVICFN